MNNNMNFSGLEDVNIEKVEQIGDQIALYRSLDRPAIKSQENYKNNFRSEI